MAALGDGAPDAVILDVRMPGMDGIAVLGVLRSYLKWATVPVAIFTAYPDDPRLWHVDLSGVTRIFGKAKTDLADVMQWVERQSTIPGPGGGDVEGCWGGQATPEQSSRPQMARVSAAGGAGADEGEQTAGHAVAQR